MPSTRHHLAKVLGERSLRLKNWKPMALQIAAYLLETSQTAQLEPLMRDIIAYRAEHGVIEVGADGAHKLSGEDLKDIRSLLKREYPAGKTFLIDQNQMSELIGGVKLELPGEQLDLTVRAKVNKFKRLTSSAEGV